MEIQPRHRWDLSPREAVSLQRELAPQVWPEAVRPPEEVRWIAGTDVAYDKAAGCSVAVVCLLNYPGLQVVEVSTARVETPFPYIPGLLSFREVPPLLEAFRRLGGEPQLVLVDGHGRAHPRRFGIACHLGLWLQKPTIGIGKSVLCGEYDKPGRERGATSPLIHRGEEIGKMLRSRSGVRPIIVSPGFGLSLPDCVRWALEACRGFRIPEPVRQADRHAAELKREYR